MSGRHATPLDNTRRDGTVPDMTPRSTAPTAGPDLSPAAVAEQIGVTKATVLELIADGRLPAYRIGQRVLRVRREDLDRFRAGDRSAARSA